MKACVVLLGLAAIESDSPLARATESAVVDPYKTLMIVHPSVVDPFLNGGRSHNGDAATAGGPWSLRYLLEWLTSTLTPANRTAFYRSLFEQWRSARTASNGASIPARDPALVDALMLDQFSTINGTGQRTFQMWKLPFELIAIAYRPDLRASDGSDAGELRFVYGLVGPDGEDQKFTLIVEYKIKSHSTLTWAHNFARLSELETGSQEYLALLQKLTWWVTTPIGPTLPALAQVRSNELAFAPSDGVWQLREFKLQRPSFAQAYFVAAPVENTPASEFNNSPTLANFISSTPLLGEPGTGFMNLKLPSTINTSGGTVPFLAGFSEVGTHWQIPDQSGYSLAVDNLGLLTCNGCHQDNKHPSDISFYHVQPNVPPGETGVPRLSLFLTTPDPDPVKQGARPGELNRRKQDLEQLLTQPWTPYWIDP